MPRKVSLDSGPLRLACHSNPVKLKESGGFQLWLAKALEKRVRIIIPAIADYEVRRELIRKQSLQSIAKLDLIQSGRHPEFPGVVYLPLTEAALKRAASLWAEARNRGYATAAREALDGDVIITAQILEDAGPASRFIVATGNVGDIARYVGARRAKIWSNILT